LISSASTTLPTATASSPPRIDRPDDADDNDPRVLVVRVGEKEYGIPIAQVREVVRANVMVRVPGASPMVRGVINVRGTVVTVLELSVLLRARRAVTVPSVVLLEHGNRVIGVAVDAVRDVRLDASVASGDTTPSEHAHVTPLDAVALCAPHLLSSEEMER
jgi:chemotaxis signal transduction protein